MKAVSRIVCLLLSLVIIVTATPIPEHSAVAATIADAAPVAVPAQRTPAMDAAESDMRAEAEAASGETLHASGFAYRLTPGGFAVITGYEGADNVTLPLTLGGASVTAVAEGAFGAGVTAATVHGNVTYMHPAAFAGHTAISALHGAYALYYAQEQGLPTVNTTDGELVPTAIDMNDAGRQATILSLSMVRLSKAAAKRVDEGSVFILNDANGCVQLFRVADMQPSGSYVLVKTETPRTDEAIINMTSEGVIYSTTADMIPTDDALRAGRRGTA